MQKVAILILGILLVSGHLFGSPNYCVTSVYRSQIGVTEEGGNNRGAAVSLYQRAAGFKDQAVPWCAAFVAWVYRLCGVESPASAWCPDWFPPSRCIDPAVTTPQPGDVFGIYYSSKGRIAHEGFVDQWPAGDYFISVEGNTNGAGSRDGDGVYRKRRLKRLAHKISRWL